MPRKTTQKYILWKTHGSNMKQITMWHDIQQFMKGQKN